MRLLYVLFICLLNFQLWGQAPQQIDWGPTNLYRPNMLALLPKNNGSFFTFHYTNSSLLPVPKISRFDNTVEVVCKKIEQRIDLKMMTLEDVFMFSDRLFGLFTDKLGTGVNVYLQEFDDEADPMGPAIEVGSYNFPKGWLRNVYVTTKVSPNSNYLVVDYLIPAKKDDFDQFGYTILDSTLTKVRSGEYEIPFSSKLTAVEARHLTDQGDYFLGVSVFSKTSMTVWKNFGLVDQSVVFHMSQKDSLRMIKLDIDQRKVYNFAINSLGNRVVITGTWGDENSKGAKGIFSVGYEVKEQNLEQVTFRDFPEDILGLENTNADKIYSVQNTDREFLNYAFRNMILQPNGDIVVLAEQFYIFEVNSTDSRGMSQVTNYYNYNDCIVYCISQTGELNWFKKIPKKQESINDFGQFSSLVNYVSQNQLVLFFNDNAQNYSETGIYNGKRVPFTNSLRLKDYCLAQTKIDLANGETNRFYFSSYETIDAFVCLKLSAVNYQSKQVVFSASRKKDKYGVLVFE